IPEINSGRSHINPRIVSSLPVGLCRQVDAPARPISRGEARTNPKGCLRKAAFWLHSGNGLRRTFAARRLDPAREVSVNIEGVERGAAGCGMAGGGRSTA